MGKYFISASAGTGKSSIITELQKRGYAAYDEDYPGIVQFEDRQSGQILTEHPLEPIDWNRYARNWRRQEIEKLLASQTTVFMAAVLSNQQEFYHLFDRIFVLTLDSETLRHRLTTRTNKAYGKQPDELAAIINYHPIRQADLLALPQSYGVDASQPLEQVVNEIVAHLI